MAKIKAVCVSGEKGRKFAVNEIQLIACLGVEGDFHAGGGDRQLSLLASESIDSMKGKGLRLDDGAFGENVITQGIKLNALNIGRHLKIGEAEIEISKIGKECKKRCVIYYQAGDCIMPKEGVFAKIIKGGKIKSGDALEILG